MPSAYWEEEFTKIGAFWFHDGRLKRPYVELTNLREGRRQVSNGYFNGSVVQQHAKLFGEACESLAAMATDARISRWVPQRAYVIAAEKGGTALSQRLAEALELGSGYAEKQADGKTLKFERFTFEPGAVFILAEDTITSGGTVGRLRQAAKAASPHSSFCLFVLAFCNRSGKKTLRLDGVEYHILSLVERPMLTWDLGKNPFTREASGGAELVEPVKAKTHWRELTRPYD
jgi:orotate phosphoribosyltransferase